MLHKLILATATLAAMTAPGLAASGTQSGLRENVAWTVLQDAGRNPCYVAERKAGPGEAQLGGVYRTEAQAQAAIAAIASCDASMTRPSDASNSSLRG